MPIFVRKPDNLILHRGTVPRPNSGDLPTIHRRFVEVLPDQVVYSVVGIGDMTSNLGKNESTCLGMKEERVFISPLLLHDSKVDAVPMNSRRRSRFQTAHLKTERAERLR